MRFIDLSIYNHEKEQEYEMENEVGLLAGWLAGWLKNGWRRYDMSEELFVLQEPAEVEVFKRFSLLICLYWMLRLIC